MATESSEQLLGGSRKRERIDLEANPLIRKLGDDLLVEILIRLPDARSAFRCKPVCQLWFSVMSDASFNRRFVSHRQMMTSDDLKSMVLCFLPPHFHHCYGVKDRGALQVLDCDKDLVLCGFRDTDFKDRAQTRSYLVCNPFTKQCYDLPPAPRKLIRYVAPVTKLVCEPQTSRNRFRVVCIYQALQDSIRLDVFCSESGEWTKDALVCDGHVRWTIKPIVSCKGELFWIYRKNPDTVTLLVDAFNPFRLDDTPHTSIDVSEFVVKPGWFLALAVSQDALHFIAREDEAPPSRSSVWRLEEDRKSWRKQCEGLLYSTSKCGSYELKKGYNEPFLHPQKPEIVFFSGAGRGEAKGFLLGCSNSEFGEVASHAQEQ
ncbi:unnamed protein product [Linum tenue]|uniref:F-box protein At3g26010-like beta-propeller domain-containing protein n=1 Tax=Linum tenue TaxID=586396 RepID=A0AAV0JSN2_9ROSI|nr:unnamed protein product [Linum tenue]